MRVKSFRKKNNKQAWNCLDSLNLQYYCDEDRKEADATLNQSYSNIESIVNRENGLVLDKKEEDEGIFANFFDNVSWLMFAGGYSAYSHDAREVFKNGVHEVQFDSFPNYDLLHYM